MPRRLPPSVPHPELDALIERARSLPPMTAEQREAQRRSWVMGEIMLANPDITREEAAARYERARDALL